MPDSGRCRERQSREADGQDQTPEDHLRDSQSQHDPRPGPELPEAGQAAGQRRGAQGPRAAAADAAAAAAGQRVQRHCH